VKQLRKVYIEDAPGYEDFEGVEYDRFAAIDGRGDLSIIIETWCNDIYIIPSDYVTHVTE